MTECPCIICHADAPDDEIEEATLASIADRGWSVMMVPEDELGPGWAYTIGLWHTHRSPEVAMFGLDVDLMKDCLDELGDQIAAGRPVVAGVHNNDVLDNYPVLLKTIDVGWYPAFFGRSIDFYRDNAVPYLQVAWPNRLGFFPELDDPQDVQPMLWLDPDDHPPGVWTQDV